LHHYVQLVAPLDEIGKLATSGLTNDELTRAKKKLIGQQRIANQSNDSFGYMAALDELQRTAWVTSSVALSLNVPMALNCFTAPAGMEELRGVIATETTVALVTVTGAVAETVPEVTVTIEVPGPTARTRPPASTVRTVMALEDHCADAST
jgi:hypothetical protein